MNPIGTEDGEMDETLPDQHEPTAGTRLREARERAGLTLGDVATRTRVPMRQLDAIEHGRYADMPSPTYAIGFARAYARAVGADEVAIAAAVRAEVSHVGARQSDYVPYDLPDPARVPSRGLVIVAAGAALAVLILLGLWYGTGLMRGEGGATPGAEPTIATAPAPPPAPAPTAAATAAPTGGQVRLTASDEVWLRVYDADDKTLFLGTMKPGDHFDVPADAKEPMVNVGRPDKLAVTLDGKPVAPLGSGDHAIKDVKISGAAIAARASGAAPAAASPGFESPVVDSPPVRIHTGRRPEPRVHHLLDATQRANLESAAHPPPPAGNSQ